MRDLSIDHIGIAVNDIEGTLKIYEQVFGVKCTIRKKVETQQVDVAVIEVSGSKLEFLQTTCGGDGPIGKFIAKRGEGIHHLAFSVENLSEALERLDKNGISLINNSPQIGVEGQEFVFITPSDMGGVLIELCQSKERGD